jgi:hypothetical protein
MSAAAELVAGFTRRGIRLALAADGIRYEAPRGAFTSADRVAVASHRQEIVEFLRAEAELPVPDGPCGLCASPLRWVEGWPTASEARWLCPACAAWPAAALAEVCAGLTSAERRQLDAEATRGDTLAVAILRELRAASGEVRPHQDGIPLDQRRFLECAGAHREVTAAEDAQAAGARVRKGERL